MIDKQNLRKLSEADEFQVKGDSHDIRGWRVLDEVGRELGTVTDLLFEPETAEVVFAEVATAGQDQLVPIEALGFEEGVRHLVVSGFVPDVSFVAAEPTLAELAERERLAPTDTLPDMARGTDYDTLR
ncbi:MAG: hypothetical protein JWM80_5447 [Cyanobacteria bacterium RYN_339]|nr:hypothetical protein [Cyanobacteria bacterium RYN_339]